MVAVVARVVVVGVIVERDVVVGVVGRVVVVGVVERVVVVGVIVESDVVVAVVVEKVVGGSRVDDFARTSTSYLYCRISSFTPLTFSLESPSSVVWRFPFER